MGQIQRLTLGQVKPYNSIPRIDWSHPLAQGLAAYCYDAGGSIIDLVNGGQITMSANGTAPFGSQQSKFGRGLQFPLDGWGYMKPLPSRSAQFGGANPFSGAMGTLFTGLTGPSSPDSACVSIQDSANTQDTSLGFNTTPASDPLFPNTVNCLVNNNFSRNFTPNITPGVFQSWAAVALAGQLILYSEGVFDSSWSNTTTFAITSPQIMYNTATNNSQTFGNGVNGFVFYFGVWGRELLPSEILLLKQDPYCFLIYPEDEMLVFMVGPSVVPSQQILFRPQSLLIGR